jgi:acyl-CoA reductase-like NAD-dependent aldehyde dehydrogenase
MYAIRQIGRIGANGRQSSSGLEQDDTSDRIECLKRGLAPIAQDQDKLVQLIVQEMGKPMAQAKEEVAGT